MRTLLVTLLLSSIFPSLAYAASGRLAYSQAEPEMLCEFLLDTPGSAGRILKKIADAIGSRFQEKTARVESGARASALGSLGFPITNGAILANWKFRLQPDLTITDVFWLVVKDGDREVGHYQLHFPPAWVWKTTAVSAPQVALDTSLETEKEGDLSYGTLVDVDQENARRFIEIRTSGAQLTLTMGIDVNCENLDEYTSRADNAALLYLGPDKQMCRVPVLTATW